MINLGSVVSLLVFALRAHATPIGGSVKRTYDGGLNSLAATAWSDGNSYQSAASTLYIIKENAILEYRFSTRSNNGFLTTSPAVSVAVPNNGINQVFNNYSPLTVANGYDVGMNSLNLFVYGSYPISANTGAWGIHQFYWSSAGQEWGYDGTSPLVSSTSISWVSSASYKIGSTGTIGLVYQTTDGKFYLMEQTHTGSGYHWTTPVQIGTTSGRAQFTFVVQPLSSTGSQPGIIQLSDLSSFTVDMVASTRIWTYHASGGTPSGTAYSGWSGGTLYSSSVQAGYFFGTDQNGKLDEYDAASITSGSKLAFTSAQVKSSEGDAGVAFAGTSSDISPTAAAMHLTNNGNFMYVFLRQSDGTLSAVQRTVTLPAGQSPALGAWSSVFVLYEKALYGETCAGNSDCAQYPGGTWCEVPDSALTGILWTPYTPYTATCRNEAPHTDPCQGLGEFWSVCQNICMDVGDGDPNCTPQGQHAVRK